MFVHVKSSLVRDKEFKICLLMRSNFCIIIRLKFNWLGSATHTNIYRKAPRSQISALYQMELFTTKFHWKGALHFDRFLRCHIQRRAQTASQERKLTLPGLVQAFYTAYIQAKITLPRHYQYQCLQSNSSSNSLTVCTSRKLWIYSTSQTCPYELWKYLTCYSKLLLNVFGRRWSQFKRNQWVLDEHFSSLK